MAKRIMYVDDEKDLLFTIKQTLEHVDNKYEVIGVSSGKECLEKLQNGEIPDLILLDIMMLEMNGWQVLEEIRLNPSWNKIPIVFLTARTDDIAVNAGAILGDDYIEKLFNAEELIQRI